MSARDITAALREALRRSFPPAEYAMFHEVSNGTGMSGGSNYADVVAMGLWPSRGLNAVGFEIKASRGDWLREKAKPEKSVAIQQYCDQWYLVTAKGVVVLDATEIPEAWGWIEMVGAKMYTRKKAPKLTAIPMTRAFIAALLRRAGQVSEDIVEARVSTRLTTERAKDEEHVRYQIQQSTRETSGAKAAIEAFEKESGLSLTGWGAGNVGREFAQFQKLRSLAGGWQGLSSSAKRLSEISEAAKQVLADLEAMGACDYTETE